MLKSKPKKKNALEKARSALKKAERVSTPKSVSQKQKAAKAVRSVKGK